MGCGATLHTESTGTMHKKINLICFRFYILELVHFISWHRIVSYSVAHGISVFYNALFLSIFYFGSISDLFHFYLNGVVDDGGSAPSISTA